MLTAFSLSNYIMQLQIPNRQQRPEFFAIPTGLFCSGWRHLAAIKATKLNRSKQHYNAYVHTHLYEHPLYRLPCRPTIRRIIFPKLPNLTDYGAQWPIPKLLRRSRWTVARKSRHTSGPVSTGRSNQPPRPTQPPTISGREMSTGQSAVILCGWEVRRAWLIPFVDACRCGWHVAGKIVVRVPCTWAPWRWVRLSITRYTNVLFTYLLTYLLTYCRLQD